MIEVRVVDWLKVIINICLMIFASTTFLLLYNTGRCHEVEVIVAAIFANVVGLLQRPPHRYRWRR